jgi:hypothetical protein
MCISVTSAPLARSTTGEKGEAGGVAVPIRLLLARDRIDQDTELEFRIDTLETNRRAS